MRSLKNAALSALVLGCLAFPAGALAAGSSQAGYSGPGGVVQSNVAGAQSGSGPNAAQSVRGGGGSLLPFTGFDALLFAGAGVLLVGGGLALRRLSGAGVGALDRGPHATMQLAMSPQEPDGTRV